MEGIYGYKILAENIKNTGFLDSILLMTSIAIFGTCAYKAYRDSRTKAVTYGVISFLLCSFFLYGLHSGIIFAEEVMYEVTAISDENYIDTSRFKILHQYGEILTIGKI